MTRCPSQVATSACAYWNTKTSTTHDAYRAASVASKCPSRAGTASSRATLVRYGPTIAVADDSMSSATAPATCHLYGPR